MYSYVFLGSFGGGGGGETNKHRFEASIWPLLRQVVSWKPVSVACPRFIARFPKEDELKGGLSQILRCPQVNIKWIGSMFVEGLQGNLQN